MQFNADRITPRKQRARGPHVPSTSGICPMQNAIPLPHRKTAADRRRLALEQIDARLSDHKNSEAQRALLIARRRYLANAERRGARARSRTFILEAARAADRSQATIYRDLR